MTGDLALAAMVAMVMVVGLAGTVLPILPGLWLIWAAGLVYTILESWDLDGLVFMAVLTALAIAGAVVGVMLPQRQASSVGVPWWGQVVAAACAVLGMFIVPIVGAVVGFVIGIFLVTAARTRELRGSVEASGATIRGMLYASGAQFVIGLLMIVLWLAWVIAL